MPAPGSDRGFYSVAFAKTCPESPEGGGLTIHTPHLSRMLREWERRGERAPIVNILGHHPAFWLGSLGLTTYGNDDYATAGGVVPDPPRPAPPVSRGRPTSCSAPLALVPLAA